MKTIKIKSYDAFRLLSFETNDVTNPDNKYSKIFRVKMFGVNEKGKSACINVKGYAPFFYVKVDDDWDDNRRAEFMNKISSEIGEHLAKALLPSELIHHKKLYGFDNGKKYNFVKINFANEAAMKKTKNLWYKTNAKNGEWRLNPDGYVFEGTSTRLYEAQIPPLLRLFHIKEISPSGWIGLPRNYKTKNIITKTTNCDYEFEIRFDDIITLPNVETRVPYKICSFDIETNSSHGDFSLARKEYTKLATNMVNVCSKNKTYTVELLKEIILTAFGFGQTENVDLVFPIKRVKLPQVEQWFETWITIKPATLKAEARTDTVVNAQDVESEDADADDDDDGDDLGDDLADADLGDGDGSDDGSDDGSGDDEGGGEEEEIQPNQWRGYKSNLKYKPYKKQGSVIELLMDTEVVRETKILELTKTLNSIFPKLQGDNITFIGSTFMRYGEDKPYLNHCIARDTCDPVPNAVIESYKTEKEVLLAWSELIQKENPDIVVGYNIFGFDYQFMFDRAKELDCEYDFLKLSRNKNEVCIKRNYMNGAETLEENTVIIASGEHNIKYVKMNGRLQIDLYNYFRREYQLSQYKLDYVAGHFMGDGVKKIEHLTEDGLTFTKIYSKNLTGLENGGFISFEEEAHSVDQYKNGEKFEVSAVNYSEGTFVIKSKETPDLVSKKVRWGLAKDDVTAQDIFRMTKEGPAQRAIIAKYCIQDCNLVQHLLRKIDVLTSYSEMAALCSVPMDFLVMRGQSIKLTSYIAQKCREKDTLMPVIEKSRDDDGYEGATVLEPKCNLYLETPIACLDYGSLYPSSMISENISHDSKVWTREYDLNHNLLAETGEKDPVTGEYIYDNLPAYEYVDITYNTYKWQRKGGNPKARMEKVEVGYKVCRFAQYPNDPETGKLQRAVMPAILEELLKARKDTRKLIETEKDEFMKNILDKRQLSIKLTANSLYGQTGAKTSAFYEKDCAASTTAIGRKLLTYGKRIIEEVYADAVLPTKKYGLVKTRAECVYGDTDSVFFRFNLRDSDDVPIVGKKALEITIELAKEAETLASQFLKGPHKLEYEKTFLPFCLLSKKRYVGMLYEDDPTKGKRKSMGIVLKRRDNSPIVKDVYGGIIDILMKNNDIEQAIEFLRSCLKNMLDGKYGTEKLIITKALKSDYKQPEKVGHKVLADRMGRRDPGNKPNTGDRIQFVYIVNSNKKALQGECIETPEYIQAHRLKINYSHYITNQIMKPVQQLFALVLEQMKDFKKKKGYTLRTWYNALKELQKQYPDAKKYREKENALRNKEVKALLFDDFLRVTTNIKNGNSAITSFYKGYKGC
jgi:DNA polymerase elongation subunit (family B)